jgi:hypothetical protein
VLVEGDTLEAEGFIKDIVGLTTDNDGQEDGETVVEEGATVEVVGVTSVGDIGETVVEEGVAADIVGVTSVGDIGETVVEEGATVEVVGVTTVFWSSRANTVVTVKTRVKTSKRHWILRRLRLLTSTPLRRSHHFS